jgi:hypothetical protein
MRAPLAAPHLSLLLLALWPGLLPALQLGGSLDVGTGPARWDQVESESARVQGSLGGSYRPGRLLGLEPELSGGFGLSTEQAVRTSARWDLTGRLHTPGAVTGAWLGVGVGGMGTDTRTAALTRLEGGVRSGIGPAGLRVWLARTSFGIRPGLDATPTATAERDTIGGGGSGKQIVEYTDLGTRAGLDLGRYELGATVIRRWGSAALQGGGLRSLAWEVSAVWWLRPSLGVVASAGHSLPELSIALPGARYRSLGVRLALGAPRRGGWSHGAAPPVTAAGATRLVVARPNRLGIVGPAADRAEVMGDFTDWNPRPLVRTGDGRWAYEGVVAPGVHQLNVRFDDGEWIVPAGTVAVDDGFGGRAGLFVVR